MTTPAASARGIAKSFGATQALERVDFDVMAETLKRSVIGGLAPGEQVNLERPVRVDGRLDGHVVQGHVDGTGVIIARRPGDG